jgi:hypothetical protein
MIATGTRENAAVASPARGYSMGKIIAYTAILPRTIAMRVKMLKGFFISVNYKRVEDLERH